MTNGSRKNSQHLPYGETEAKLILNQLKTGMGKVETTSCGRVLDAVAAVLGVCFERTYEGEPAMKLESAAFTGKDILKLKPKFHGDVLETSCMIREIYDNLGKGFCCRFSLFCTRLLGKRLSVNGNSGCKF